MRERGMNHRGRNTKAQLSALACAGVLGWGLFGCGAAIDGEAGFEEDEALVYGESEQALRRFAGEFNANTAGTLDPGEPPPPLPPPDPCKTDPRDDVRAALGQQVLKTFGRTDPRVWECLPSFVVGCAGLRLSPALRQNAIANGQQAAVEQVEELLGALTELDGMTAFAMAVNTALSECAVQNCSTASRSYAFTAQAPNECGETVYKVDATVHRGLAGEVMNPIDASRAVLAPASPVPAPPIKPVSSAASLRFAASSRATTTGTKAPANPAPSPSPDPAPTGGVSDTQLKMGDMGGYFGLYGGYRTPCPAEDTSCNATGVNTAIKTFLDQTCEGTPTNSQDVCHHPTYDGDYGVFAHKLKSFPGAVRKRLGEACEYGADSNIRSGRFRLGAGALALCVAE